MLNEYSTEVVNIVHGISNRPIWVEFSLAAGWELSLLVENDNPSQLYISK